MNQNFTAKAIGKAILQAPAPTEKVQMPEQPFTEQDWRRLLSSLGEDPDRAGLVETPSRVANALMTHLEPQAVGVVIRCRHLCMESRGIRTQGEETVTSSMLGALQPNQALRAEFFALAREV